MGTLSAKTAALPCLALLDASSTSCLALMRSTRPVVSAVTPPQPSSRQAARQPKEKVCPVIHEIVKSVRTRMHTFAIFCSCGHVRAYINKQLYNRSRESPADPHTIYLVSF